MWLTSRRRQRGVAERERIVYVYGERGSVAQTNREQLYAPGGGGAQRPFFCSPLFFALVELRAVTVDVFRPILDHFMVSKTPYARYQSCCLESEDCNPATPPNSSSVQHQNQPVCTLQSISRPASGLPSKPDAPCVIPTSLSSALSFLVWPHHSPAATRTVVSRPRRSAVLIHRVALLTRRHPCCRPFYLFTLPSIPPQTYRPHGARRTEWTLPSSSAGSPRHKP